MRCLIALACLLLTACGSIHTKAPGWAAPMRVPSELADPVEEPKLPEDATNADLGEFADALQDALREANRRLRAIRDL